MNREDMELTRVAAAREEKHAKRALIDAGVAVVALITLGVMLIVQFFKV